MHFKYFLFSNKKKSLHHRNIFSDLYVKCVIENMNRRYQCQIVPGRALLSQCAVIILIKSCVTRLPPLPLPRRRRSVENQRVSFPYVSQYLLANYFSPIFETIQFVFCWLAVLQLLIFRYLGLTYIRSMNQLQINKNRHPLP